MGMAIVCLGSCARRGLTLATCSVADLFRKFGHFEERRDKLGIDGRKFVGER